MSDPTAIDIDFDPRVQRMRGIATHGNTPFEVPFISEIVPGLYQGGCSNGLVLPENIKHVISLYKWERYTVYHGLSSILTVTMYDSHDLAAVAQIDAIATWVNTCREEPGDVLVHCQAGLNRSSLIAARALMLEGWHSDDAIDQIRMTRSPACLCNKTFETFLRSLDG